MSETTGPQDTAPETTGGDFDATGAVNVLLDISGGDLDLAEALIARSRAQLVADGTLTNRALYQLSAMRTEIESRRS